MLLARALRKGLRKAGLSPAELRSSLPILSLKPRFMFRFERASAALYVWEFIRVDGEASAFGGIHHHPACILGHAG
mgnify:CR=1 FL=1